MRLYPAVIIYSIIAVFLIGPIATNVSLSQYFHSAPWNNLWNATLWEWIYNLPHLFSDRPFAGATNGSTWTLPVELRCYIAVFAFGLLGLFNSREMANVALILALLLIKFNCSMVPLFGGNVQFQEPLLFFVIGSLFWVNREYIYLSWLLCFLLVGSVFWFAGTAWYPDVYIPTVVYVALMIAYRLPHVDMDKFGDISYGVYIYAWPIQQLVWVPGQGPYMNALYASLIVLPLAYFSWRFVEKPALKLRRYLGAGSKKLKAEIASRA